MKTGYEVGLMRVGLGCMRLSTEPGRGDEAGLATVRAAWDAGIRTFDTAHAYGLDESDVGANERLVATALAGFPARIITKGGMTRPSGKWVPDGRASTIQAHAEASAEALGRPPDLFLVHAVDPRVPWDTTVRALRAVLEGGLARAIGVCNVNLLQLDRALDLAPLSAVQCALSVRDDSAIRSGVLARCAERRLEFLAHSPLGGVRHAVKTLASLESVARERGTSAAVVALRALLEIDPCVTVIPGARRPETARDVVLAERPIGPIPSFFPPLRVVPAAVHGDGELVLLMGLQGAGKSAQVEAWCARGHVRLNRDELGGTMEALARRYAALVASGTRRVVMDNTFTTRASRGRFLALAAEAGIPVRGVWFDVPLHEAQVNVIWRMLDRHGRLLTPEELKRGGDDNTRLPPLAQLRTLKDLEVPELSEGFTSLETRPFHRKPRGTRGAVFLADGLEGEGVRFGWYPEAAQATALRERGGLVCDHGAGPPVCWCRPPLPGLLLAYASQHDVDLAQSEVHGLSEVHEVMAQVVGARFVRRSA